MKAEQTILSKLSMTKLENYSSLYWTFTLSNDMVSPFETKAPLENSLLLNQLEQRIAKATVFYSTWALIGMSFED